MKWTCWDIRYLKGDTFKDVSLIKLTMKKPKQRREYRCLTKPWLISFLFPLSFSILSIGTFSWVWIESVSYGWFKSWLLQYIATYFRNVNILKNFNLTMEIQIYSSHLGLNIAYNAMLEGRSTRVSTNKWSLKF